MPLRTLTLAALCAALLAACSGSAESVEPTPQPVWTATTAIESPAAPTATATSTPTSAPSPSATPTAEPASPTAEPATPTAAATVANTPAPTAGGNTAPPTTVSQPPTATPTPASANPMTATIGAASARNLWSPSRVTVGVGGTVEWKWNDAPALHNVVGENFSLGPTEFKKSESVKFTFNAAGTYTFVCQSHPDMRGTVTVQ